MAIIFELWVETGESKEDASKIQNYFNSVGKITTEFGAYRISVYQSGLNGTMITVEGIPTRGEWEYSEEIAKELSLIGYEYYKHLKNAPDFRYALVGFDVDGCFELKDFKEEPSNLTLIPGIVIRKDLYEMVGSPGNFIEFRPNYVWKPYKGIP